MFILWFNNFGISIFSFTIFKFDVKFNFFEISRQIFLFSYLLLFWFITLLFAKLLFSIIDDEDEELLDFFIEDKLSKERSLSELIMPLLLFIDLLLSFDISFFFCWLSFNKIKGKII